jgi:sulfite exporter TauE/SafE
VVSGWIQGLALGLSTGVYCLAVCVPALAPYAMGDARGARGSLATIAEFAAGRFIAYLLIGVGVAYVGSAFASSPFARVGAGAAVVILAALLLAHGIMRNWPSWGACERLGRLRILRRYPILAGLALGFNPCPPLVLCAAAIAGTGSIPYGVAMASGFAAGTFLFLVPLAVSGAAARWAPARRMAEIATLFGGLFFLCSGLGMVLGR